MSTPAPDYRLFPNGTAFMMWTERNCDLCLKQMPAGGAGENPKCAIETAIALGACTDGTLLHDGTKPAEEAADLARRLNWDGVSYLETDCPEIEELTHYDEAEHVEPLSVYEAKEAAAIARELLTRRGWTGAQLDWLAGVAAMAEDDPEALTLAEEMRDARDREEALRA